MRRLLHITKPVGLYPMMEGKLVDLGVNTHSAVYVVRDEQLLIRTLLGAEVHLAIPVHNRRREEEKSYLLPQDFEELAPAVDRWKLWRDYRGSVVSSYEAARCIRYQIDRVRDAIWALSKPYLWTVD